MNFKEALEYAKAHYQDNEDTETAILGITHMPDDDDAEFYIIELLYEPASTRVNMPATRDVEGNTSEGYCAYMQSGGLPAADKTGRYFSCNTPDDLMAELPDFAESLNYQSYTSEEPVFDAEFTEALTELFPSLPDVSHPDFKRVVIETINKHNGVAIAA